MNAHAPITATTKTFRVDWAGDITNASSPQEAAFLASEVLNDPTNTASIYSVTDKQTGQITVVDIGGNETPGNNYPAKRPEDTAFTRRTLRPGLAYQTRSGLPVEILVWDGEGPFPLHVRINDEITGLRAKDGSHPQGGEHPLDVFEANPTIVKWVRLYDKKLNEAGKQVVSGKEFAAERGLNWYIFDTEAEARASLHGVRAVFKVEYREGEGVA